MFKIEYEQNGIQMPTIYSNDIKDVGQILINIANDERTENEAMQWCGQASFGDNYVNQKFKFTIQCVYDKQHVFKPGTDKSKLVTNPNKFKDEVFLQKVANEISKRTGIKNRYAGYKEDGITVNWDFNFGLSYMTNNGGKELYFCCNDKSGNHLWGCGDINENMFIKTVSEKLTKTMSSIRENSKTMRNSDIIKNLNIAKSKNIDVHYRIYDDGCWVIDIDRFKNGQIRFWVSFEDKRNGHSRASLVGLYWLNKELKYTTDGILIKKAVWEKIQSTAKALIDNGLYSVHTNDGKQIR